MDLQNKPMEAECSTLRPVRTVSRLRFNHWPAGPGAVRFTLGQLKLQVADPAGQFVFLQGNYYIQNPK